MSDLKQELQEAVKTAMKDRDKARLKTLRLIMSDIKQQEVDQRVELSDEDIIALLTKMAKRRQESISQFTQGERLDLVDQESAELVIIKEFLPEPLSDSELDQLITTTIKEQGASSIKEMGAVMALIRDKVQGRADMGTVSQKVKHLLSS